MEKSFPLFTLWGDRVAAAFGIETFLLPFPGRRSVVRGTPLAGTLFPMVLPAAERATQIQTTCVPRMSEKPNPAVNTESQTAVQLGIGLQDRVQRGLILADKRVGAIVLVPIIAKRENFLDCYDKKARLSVIMRIVSFTPSSYFIDAKASRGRARFFCEIENNQKRPSPQTIHYLSAPQAIRLARSTQTRCVRYLEMTTWKRRSSCLPFFFPSSGAF